MKRKFFSILLVVSMMLSLFPTAVFAATSPTGSIIKVDGVDGAIPGDFQGMVATLSNTGGIYKVTVGMYNVGLTNAYNLRFLYDASVVTFCNSDGQIADDMDEPITPSTETVYIENYSEDMLVPGLKDTQINTMLSKKINDDKYGFVGMMLITDVSEGNEGKIKVDVQFKPTIDASAPKFVAGLVKATETVGNSYTPPENTLVNLYNFYFKLNDGKEIGPDTFSLFGDETTGQAGAKTGYAGQATTYGACFLGFPQAVKVPETFTGIIPYALAAEPSNKEDSSTWTYLPEGSTVNIWVDKTTHMPTEKSATPESFGVAKDGSSKGQLTGEDGSPTTLTLIEDEEYPYSVVPAKGHGLETYDGKLTVTAADHEKVFMWAQAATPVNYALKIGGNGNAVLQGATVTVTNASGDKLVDGVETNESGVINFSGYPNQTYNVTVSAPGYQTVTGTVTTGASGIDTYGGDLEKLVSNGQINLPAPQTSVKVTVKYAADDAETAVQNQPVPNATVTMLGEGSKTAGDDGTVTLTLPAGTYNLRASGGGRGSGETKALVISDSGVTFGGTAVTDKTGDTYNVELRVGGKLEDPVYKVQGDWVDKEDHSKGMKFTVSIENVQAALNGTFGIQWDKNVFKLADTNGFTFDDTTIAVPPMPQASYPSQYPNNYAFDNPFQPKSDSDEAKAQYQYHGFYWEAVKVSGEYKPIDATGGAVKIAEYILVPANDSVNLDDVLNDKTVTARSFLKTSGGTATEAAFGAGTDIAKEALSMFWQNIDWIGDFRNEGKPYKLDDDKALDGGFYQIFQADENATMRSQDIMMDIQYTSSKLAVKFNVTAGDSGVPVAGAKVTIQDKDGTPIIDPATGKAVEGETDAYGDVTIQIPTSDPNALLEYYFSAKKNGFKKYPELSEGTGVKLSTVAKDGKLPDVVPIKMEPDASAKVFLSPSDRLNLLGSNRAPMGEDYLFNVAAKPGYTIKDGGLQTSDFELVLWELPTTGEGENKEVVWTDGTDPNDGFTAPDGVTLTTNLKKHDGSEYSITGVTWDSASNSFKIAGSDIKMNGFYLIEIKVKEPNTNVPEATGYKVSAKAGTGGFFTVVAPVATGSTFVQGSDGSTTITDTDMTTNHQTDTIETLAAKGTESSTYFLQTDGPIVSGYTGSNTNVMAGDNAALKAANGVYYGYVINQLFINGVEVPLTHPERIHGVKEKLTDIAADQTIVVTYEIAKIDAKNTPNPADDEIIGEEEPVGNAVVTLSLGQRGTAKVTYDSVNDAAQSGDTTVNYTVTGATFTAVIKADSGITMPDSATANYEIDKVYVIIDDGDPQCIFSDDDPNAAGAVKAVASMPEGITWTGTAGQEGSGTPAGFKEGTVEVSGLTAGKHVTILATFKVDGGAAMQAWVQTVNEGGNGGVSPSGLTAYSIGAEPVYTITPDAGWALSTLTVAVNGGAPGGRKSDATENAGVYTYKMEPLQSGTTALAFKFTENTYRVSLTVHYGDMNLEKSPYTHAKITFVRTAGGDGTDMEKTIPVPNRVPDDKKNAAQEYEINLAPGTWTVTVSKNGYLPFTVEGFQINTNGTAVDTAVDGSGDAAVIRFGTDTSGKAHYIAPKIGDADWSGTSVNLRDISQMVNGMAQNASSASKAHADLDETAMWSSNDYLHTDDYGYVIAAYGKKATDYQMSYSEFIAESKYEHST